MTLSDVVREMRRVGCSEAQIAKVAIGLTESPPSPAALRKAKSRAKLRPSNVTVTRDGHKTPSPEVLPEVPPKDNIKPPSYPSPSPNPSRLFARAEAESFAVFWQRWPNKVGKPAAQRAFAKHAHELPAILEGIARYEREKPPDRPWLNPATYLNQERWTDQPAPCAPINGYHVNGHAHRPKSQGERNADFIRKVCGTDGQADSNDLFDGITIDGVAKELH